MTIDIKLSRYNPRRDKDDVIKLVAQFEGGLYPIDITKFDQQLDKRSKDLILRNSIVLARGDQDELVGVGFFTPFADHAGNEHAIIHRVIVGSHNAFKQGIEEKIMKELFKYIKSTMKIDKVSIDVHRKESNLLSILMKMGFKRSTDLTIYEKNI